MIFLNGHFMGFDNGLHIQWQVNPSFFDSHGKGITISLRGVKETSNKQFMKKVSENILKTNKNDKNIPNKFGGLLYYYNTKWYINLIKLKDIGLNLASEFNISNYSNLEKVSVEPEIEENKEQSIFKIVILEEDIKMSQPKNIFLSHSGIDKPLIRKYKLLLEEIGFSIWIDEHSMSAGDHLENGLLNGIESSCAIVFFVSRNFKDENYLEKEINYAIQKNKKNNNFKIITLVFNDEENKLEVPERLKDYVYKEISNDLLGMKEIIKALPIKVGEVYWK